LHIKVAPLAVDNKQTKMGVNIIVSLMGLKTKDQINYFNDGNNFM